LDIKKGKETETMGINGANKIYLHEIALYIPGGLVFTEAGFSDDLPLLGLLCMRGFFEHFNIVFNPTARQVELDRLYRI
jgi:hypothetical protein